VKEELVIYFILFLLFILMFSIDEDLRRTYKYCI